MDKMQHFGDSQHLEKLLSKMEGYLHAIYGLLPHINQTHTNLSEIRNEKMCPSDMIIFEIIEYLY